MAYSHYQIRQLLKNTILVISEYVDSHMENESDVEAITYIMDSMQANISAYPLTELNVIRMLEAALLDIATYVDLHMENESDIETISAYLNHMNKLLSGLPNNIITTENNFNY